MLERLFSKRLRYRNYAIGTALFLGIYLVGGFIAVKWLFLGKVPMLSISNWLLFAIGMAAFAGIHVASMRQLDRASRSSRKR